jgi:hypothetical protein
MHGTDERIAVRQYQDAMREAEREHSLADGCCAREVACIEGLCVELSDLLSIERPVDVGGVQTLRRNEPDRHAAFGRPRPGGTLSHRRSDIRSEGGSTQ